LHISDLVRAFRAAVESTVSGVYNIGSGRAVTLNDIVSVISAVTGRQLEVIYSGKRKLDVPVNFLDIRKAEKELGWKPEISLEQGIRKTVEWLKAQ
ncbi:MAG: GDP-mannose 4,6-dehydratase, partial [Pseudomonadota bacterium]